MPMLFLNHFLVTEPEAVGVPGWQTGTKALCLYSQSPQACKPVHRAPTWLTTALVEWHCTLSWLRGRGQTLCQVTMPLLSIKACSCYFPPERGLLRMTHHYLNNGQNWSRLFVRERVELLIELFGAGFVMASLCMLLCFIERWSMTELASIL